MGYSLELLEVPAPIAAARDAAEQARRQRDAQELPDEDAITRYSDLWDRYQDLRSRSSFTSTLLRWATSVG